LFKQELLSPQAIEETVDWLHEILQTTERLNNLVVAHEILDLNKYKVIHNPLVLRNTLRKDALKPFIFLNCKN
jgi:Asp-tRNA(Asn)/Glu-tRNA(Gln) amidotransferase C subunit